MFEFLTQIQRETEVAFGKAKEAVRQNAFPNGLATSLHEALCKQECTSQAQLMSFIKTTTSMSLSELADLGKVRQIKHLTSIWKDERLAHIQSTTECYAKDALPAEDAQATGMKRHKSQEECLVPNAWPGVNRWRRVTLQMRGLDFTQTNSFHSAGKSMTTWNRCHGTSEALQSFCSTHLLFSLLPTFVAMLFYP